MSKVKVHAPFRQITIKASRSMIRVPLYNAKMNAPVICYRSSSTYPIIPFFFSLVALPPGLVFPFTYHPFAGEQDVIFPFEALSMRRLRASHTHPPCAPRRVSRPLFRTRPSHAADPVPRTVRLRL